MGDGHQPNDSPESSTEAVTWVDAERDVLGAILSGGSYGVGGKILDRALAEGLRPYDFYRPTNGLLFALLIDLDGRGIPLDPVSVAAELEARGREQLGALAGLDFVYVDLGLARARLESLAHEATGFSNVEHHARLVREAADRRRAAAAR